MKFLIARASDWLDEKVPCEGCDVYTIDRGDESDRLYTIYFEDLNALMTFVKKHGSIVIDKNGIVAIDFPEEIQNLPAITIYDDYLE